MTTVVIMTTEEFKQYVIQYFKKSKSQSLYRLFKAEYEQQRYAYRSEL
jgi:hypothetical protein